MPMTGAERQKKYIERLKQQNPEKYEEKRKKHLEKVKQNSRKISDLIDSEKEARRRKWKEANDRRKEKIKQAEKQRKEEDLRKKRETYAAKRNLYLKVENAKLKLENKKLHEKISRMMKRIVVMKKRIYRNKIYNERVKAKNQSQTTATDTQPVLKNIPENDLNTPMSKASSFVEEIVVREEDKEKVKRKVFELNVLSESLKQQYTNADTNNEKKVLKKVVNNDLVKKYSLTTKLASTLGLKGRIRNYETVKEAKEKDNVKKIKEFFLRDDVSRATAGRKECKTLKKDKQQKRFLLDSMKNLHMKYISEGGKDSYTTFTRCRPFYVMNPSLSDRETCACVKHSNLILKAEKLKTLKVIPSCKVTDLVTDVSCNINSKQCMYNTCSSCMSKSASVSLEENTNNINITWQEWGLKKHEYSKILKTGERQPMTTKKIVKDTKSGTIGELIQKFNKELKAFKTHYYNIGHQHKALQNCIRDLSEDEVVIICDFSENYAGKLHEEVQSVTLGGNREQTSLHTGVIYTKNNPPASFCTVSPCCDHDPGAIWAHLSPVFEYVKQIVPSVKVIHMFSDGPATQYKQKKNFYLFSKNIEESTLDYATWSFFEASHGKGAADGVGGAVKRTLDDLVSHGTDIPNASVAFKMLKESEKKVKTFFVSEEEIREMQQNVPDKLIPLPGTMKLHQIITTAKQGSILYRDLSCFCGPKKGCCACYEKKTHDLIQKSEQIKNKSKKLIKRKPTKTSKYINNKRSRSEISTDSDNYNSDDIPYADSDNSSYCEEDWLEEVLDIDELEETEMTDDTDTMTINLKNEKDNSLPCPSTSNSNSSRVAKTPVKILSEEEVMMIQNEKTGNSYCEEDWLEEVLDIDELEETEMTDDTDTMTINLKNEKDNSLPCPSTSNSNSSRVAKTPVKILSEEEVMMIQNEKTGNSYCEEDWLEEVLDIDELEETEMTDDTDTMTINLKNEKDNSLPCPSTSNSNSSRVAKTPVKILSEEEVMMIQNEKTGNSYCEEDWLEEVLDIDELEETEMTDDTDTMTINLKNEKDNSLPCPSTSNSNSSRVAKTPVKILSEEEVMMIQNEKTGNSYCEEDWLEEVLDIDELEETEMTDDTDTMTINLKNEKDNSLPCPSTSNSNSSRVAKTPVKILSEEEVMMILNEKTGKVQIVRVKNVETEPETDSQEKIQDEKFTKKEEQMKDSDAKEEEVKTNNIKNMNKKAVLDTQLIENKAVHLKTKEDIKENIEMTLNEKIQNIVKKPDEKVETEPENDSQEKIQDEKFTKKEEQLMDSDAKQEEIKTNNIKIMNKKAVLDTQLIENKAVRLKTKEDIKENIEVQMILNEKIQNIVKKPDEKVETESETGNKSEFQGEKCESNDWKINDTVLVRYYIKKSWKYYVGVIENIDNDNTCKSYKINYFKTVHQKGTLKFTKSKVIKDVDTVPRDCIVKQVNLLQVSNKSQEFVLSNEEDASYF